MRRWWAGVGMWLVVAVTTGGCGWIASYKATQAEACFGRAMAYRASGRTAEALGELERAVAADPTFYIAYYQLGMMYKAMGKPALARQWWTRGIQAAMASYDRPEFPRLKAIAEMRAALASLERPPLPRRAAPAPKPQPPKARPSPPPPRPPQASRPAAPPSSPPAKGRYAVLFSSNLKRANALADARLLKLRGFRARISTYRDRKGRIWHRVWAGCCTSLSQARAMAKAVAKATGRRGVVAMAMRR